jgi:hypothetical protein
MTPTFAFFMVTMIATLGGRPVNQFNLLARTESRNVTTADLHRTQLSGAQMLDAEQVQYDNLVLQNMFLLFEGTEEDFTREGNELMTQQANEQLAQAMGAKPIEQAVQDAVAESIADARNVQAEEAAEASPPEPAPNSGSDRDEDAGR